MDTTASPLPPIIRGMLLTALGLRLVLGTNLLNQFVGYTLTTGPLLAKLHPATYLELAAIILMLVTPHGFKFLPKIDVPIVGLVAAAVVALLLGALNTAVIIIDSAVFGGIMMHFAVQYGPAFAKRLIKIALMVTLLNFPIMAAELAVRQQFIPRPLIEQFFRPAGLLDHPLNVGFICVLLMWCVLRSNMRPLHAVPISAILFLEVVAASVRLPLTLATILFAWQIITIGRGLQWRLMTTIAAAVALPSVLWVVFSLGMLNRLLTMGFWDNESAGSRVVSVALLGKVDWSATLFGVEQWEFVKLLNFAGISTLENSFVFYVLTSGLIVAVLIHAALIRLLWPVMRHDPLFLLVFAGMLAGSLSFSTKTPNLSILLVASLQYRRAATVPDAQRFRVVGLNTVTVEHHSLKDADARSL